MTCTVVDTVLSDDKGWEEQASMETENGNVRGMALMIRYIAALLTELSTQYNPQEPQERHG